MSLVSQILIIALVLLNVITFFSFGFDKMRSRGAGRRVRERTLWLLSLLGGSAGALLGMHFFRHKTKKLSFQAGMAVILALQVCLAVWWLR